MKKLRVFTVILVVLLTLMSFISCNSEIGPESIGFSSVSFAPAVSKALNQSGSQSASLAHDASSYYWTVYCSTEKPTDGVAGFKAFDSTESGLGGKGLGTIKNLTKGAKYYFGLKGYTDEGCSDLVWEGWCYGENDSSAETAYNNAGTAKYDSAAPVTLTAKNQLIRIDVDAVGKGYIFFDFYAPAAYAKNTQYMTETNGSWTVKNAEYNDKFEISWRKLNGVDTSSTTVAGTLTTDGNYYKYSTDGQSASSLNLEVGTYMFTIKQLKYYDGTGNDVRYTEVNQRKQVLIVDIVQGVDTLVSGSLDSTALTFDYYANALDVIFHKGDASSVTKMNVTVSTDQGNVAIVHDNDIIEVYDGKYAVIHFSSASDTKFYVNGKMTSSTTTTTDGHAGCLVREDGKATLIKASGTDLYCYGKVGGDYIVTIGFKSNTTSTDAQSVSFTIKGVAQVENKASGAVSTSTDNQLTSTDNKVKVTISKEIAAELSATNMALSVTETEKSGVGATYEIKLKKSNDGTSYTDVSSVSNFVTAELKLETGLVNVTVKHSGTAMKQYTSKSEFDAATTASDANGATYYDEATGILYLKSASFSPFAVSYAPVAQINNQNKYGRLQDAFDAAKSGDTVYLLTDTSLEIKQTFKYYADNSETRLSGLVVTANFDGNGHKVTIANAATTPAGKEQHNAVYVGTSNLTIKDVYFDCSTCNNRTVYIGGADNVVFDNVSIEAKQAAVFAITADVVLNNCYVTQTDTTSTNVLRNNALQVQEEATLTVNGGTYVSTNGNVLYAPNNTNNYGNKSFDISQIVVNNGTFKGGVMFAQFKLSAGKTNKTALIINGGDFTDTVWNSWVQTDYTEDPVVEINGGEFSDLYKTTASDYVFNNTTKVASVGGTMDFQLKGGNYVATPTDTDIADGYKKISVDDGWIVRSKKAFKITVKDANTTTATDLACEYFTGSTWADIVGQKIGDYTISKYGKVVKLTNSELQTTSIKYVETGNMVEQTDVLKETVVYTVSPS